MALRRLLLVVALLLAPSVAQATDYYVAPAPPDGNGNNTNNGSIGAPWATPLYALQHAACGDTIYLRGNVHYWNYDTAINTQGNTATSCGSFDNTVTMRSYPGETAAMPFIFIFAEQYLIFRDFTLQGHYSGDPGETISIGSGGGGGSHIRFINMDVHGPRTVPCNPGVETVANSSSAIVGFGGNGSNEFIGGIVHDATGPSGGNPDDDNGPHGFYVSSPNNLVDGTEIHHLNSGFGIHAYGVGRTITHNVYRNLFIHHIGQSGSSNQAIGIFGDSDDSQVYNNVITASTYGIYVGTLANRILVYNNTIYGLTASAHGAIELGGEVGGGANSIVRNNLIYNNAANTILSQYANTPTIDHNICIGSAPECIGSANPQFVNSGGSYALQSDFAIPTGSNAKDAGYNTSSVVTTDSQGTSRPQGSAVDIGAFEFIVLPGGNLAPDSTITLPTSNTTISAGESVTFNGSGDDPDGHTPLTYLWNFGSGGPSNSTLQNPGATTFPNAGTYVVTFTVTDSQSLADPTPATVTITVNAAPTGCSTKADGFTGSGTLGSTWTAQNDSVGATAMRVSGAAETTATSLDILYFCSASLATDQYAEITLGTMTTTTYVGAEVRASSDVTVSTMDGYVGIVSSNTWQISRFLNGGFTQLATGSGTFTSGDVVRLTVAGSTLTLTKNAGSISGATAVDSSLTSGKGGMSFYGTGTKSILAWAADDVAAPNTPSTAPAARTRFRR